MVPIVVFQWYILKMKTQLNVYGSHFRCKIITRNKLIYCKFIKCGAIYVLYSIFRYNKLRLYPPQYTSELGPVNTNLAIAVTFIWISVSIFMIIGFKHFQKIFMSLIQFTFLALLLVFVSTLFLSRKYHPESKFYSHPYWIADLEVRNTC